MAKKNTAKKHRGKELAQAGLKLVAKKTKSADESGDRYRTFGEWKRNATRQIAAVTGQIGLENCQHMYVVCFLQDFTTWPNADMSRFFSK